MSVVSKLKSRATRAFPKAERFTGAAGEAWFFGALERAPSMAGFFCGAETAQVGTERLRQGKIAGRCLDLAGGGAVTVYSPGAGLAPLAELTPAAVELAPRIALTKTLPGDEEALMAGVKNSTTREDLRRIRKAGFTYRITSDPEEFRTFHKEFYVPLVRQQFPEDGTILSLEKMLETDPARPREIVCAELDGRWVAGLMTRVDGANYAMAQLGILKADPEVRRSRVVSALLVRSMQRAVERGLATTSLGFSLPFLGKGPIWFKAKWGAALGFEPARPRMQVLMDLRHGAIRQSLATCPLLHCAGDELVATGWLEPGPAPLKALAREAERYEGIARWHILGRPETLAEAAPVLEANPRVVSCPFDPDAPAAAPVWLGAFLADRTV